MNEFRFRRLAEMQVGRSGNTLDLRVPLPRTLNGHVNHRCPANGCRPGLFQLGEAPSDRVIPEGALVRRQPGVAGTTCPYCGLDAPDQDFLTEEDKGAAFEQVKWAAFADVQEHFGKLLDDMARNSRGILKVTGSKSIPSKPVVPRRAALPRAIRCNVELDPIRWTG